MAIRQTTMILPSTNRDSTLSGSARVHLGKADEGGCMQSGLTFSKPPFLLSRKTVNSRDAPGSTIFQIPMGRAEPGRLDAMRRLERILPRRHADGIKAWPHCCRAIRLHAGMASYALHFRPLAVMSAASGSKKSSVLDAPLTSFKENPRHGAHPSRRLFCPVTSARTVDSLGAP